MKRYIKIIISFSLIIFFLIPLTSSTELEDCIFRSDISCENCVAIKIDIKPTPSREVFHVGGYFHYNITLINMGNDSMVGDFEVTVFNPDKEMLGSRPYRNVVIEKDGYYNLFPNQTANNSVHDIFPFDLSGVYKIKVNSTKPVNFYKFYEDCAWVRYSTENYYFDAMPKWQKEVLDMESKRYENIENLNKNLSKLTGELRDLTWGMKNLTLDLKNITTELRDYSFWLLVITGVLAFVAVCDLISSEKKKQAAKKITTTVLEIIYYSMIVLLIIIVVAVVLILIF